MEKRPNILLITTDHHNNRTFKTEAKMPHLQSLKNQGMYFSRAYTPMPVCCPTRAMWHSGTYPWYNGVFTQVHSTPSLTRDLYENTETYSQKLRDAGYATAFVGKWHASWYKSPCDFGFQQWAHPQICRTPGMTNITTADIDCEKTGDLRLVYEKKLSWPGSEPFTMWGHFEGDIKATNTYQTAQSAVRLIQKYTESGDAPWHISVNFTEPHDPYLPHKDYLDLYADEEVSLPESVHDNFDGKPGMHRRESQIWGNLSDDEIREGRKHYLAYCSEIDENIGRIQAALREANADENTVIIYTSDHGDMLGAHGMWIKSWMPYEEVWNVPLIIRYPKMIKAGTQNKRVVNTHWFANTILDFADVGRLKNGFDDSLTPYFQDEKPRDTDMAFCVGYGCEFLVTQRMVVTDRYKYVFNGFDFDEMYDLENDPNEMHNLAEDDTYARDRSDLQARLYELMNKYHDPYADLSPYSEADSSPGDRYGAQRYLPRGRRK